MLSAAFRIIGSPALLALALTSFILPPPSWAAEKAAPARGAPSRPAQPPTLTSTAGKPGSPGTKLRLDGMDYVSATDIAVWLGFKGTWILPLRKMTLTSKTNAANRVELTAESRIVLVDGLRVILGNRIVVRKGHLFVGRTDLMRTLAPLMRPTALAFGPPAPKVIALDAGHGGNDPGMQNTKLGVKEKVLALDVVMRAKKLLEAAGYKVILTRTSDRALSNDKRKDLLMRAERANRASADLFVSVHFNSVFPDTRTSGTEIYVYTPAGQRSTASLSAGQSDDTDDEVLPVNRFDPWSSLLAHKIHRETIERLKTSDRGQKTMHSLVLRDLRCPAVLVESVFLSNEAEARRASTATYRQQIAAALVSGIQAYAAAVAPLKLSDQQAQLGKAASYVSPFP